LEETLDSGKRCVERHATKGNKNKRWVPWKPILRAQEKGK
jgi:hypothetical protein